MQEQFELETILTVITGIRCTNDDYKIFEFLEFLFESPINEEDISNYIRIARRHLFWIHPELKQVKYNPNVNFEKWLNIQKSLYGNKLTISIIGEPVVNLEKRTYQSHR